MRFSEKQEKVSIYELENGARDAVILTNEREVTKTEPLEDGKKKDTTEYEYDGNIFRTHSLTAEQIKADPESYLDYEQNMTIDYGQQMSLGDIVNRVVVDSLGGKDSNAYHEIGRKVFAECNRDLKHYFNINARNNVPKKKFDEAVDYVKNWQPCTNTRIMIQDCNAQLSM